MHGLRLRPAAATDLPLLAALYALAASRLGPAVYGPAQVAAWAAFADDETGFRDYVVGPETRVACAADGTPLGFCGLAADGEVRSLYVHPAAGRRGIATRLLADALQRARERGLPLLQAWVTPFSEPVFARAGFSLVQTVQAPFAGVMFERRRMRLALEG